MTDGAAANGLEGTTVGGFRLESLVGSTTWGDEWSVRRAEGDDDQLYTMVLPARDDEQLCALVIDALSEVKRVHAGSSLRHPNVLQFVEAGIDNGAPFVVVESFPGSGLDAQIGEWVERGEVDDDHDERVAELFVEIGTAVQHGHEFGIAHGDLRSTNVLIDGERVRLRGYGFESVADDVRGLRRARLAMCAPELLDDDEHEPDEGSDLYALGVMMYESLTLRMPFEGSGRDAIRRAIMRGDAPTPAQLEEWIPKSLSRIVAQAMSCHAEERYPSIEAFVADLYRFLDGEPVSARAPSAAKEALGWAADHPRMALGAVGGALALTLMGTLMTGGSSGTNDGALAQAKSEPARVAADTSRVASEPNVVEDVDVFTEVDDEPFVADVATPVIVDPPAEETREREDTSTADAAEPVELETAQSTEPSLPVIPTVVIETSPVMDDVAQDVADTGAMWSDEIGEPVELENLDGEDDVADAWGNPLEQEAVVETQLAAGEEALDAMDESPVADAENALDTMPAAQLALEPDADSDTDDVIVAAEPEPTIDADFFATELIDTAPVAFEPIESDVDDAAFATADDIPFDDIPFDDAALDDTAAGVITPTTVDEMPVLDVIDEPEVVVETTIPEPEPPRLPPTRAERMQDLAAASLALRNAHVDAGTSVVVESIFTPERRLESIDVWSRLGDPALAEAMPELGATAESAAGRLSVGLTVPARTGRVEHGDWEAAFETFIVIGAVPPTAKTNADLPSVDIVGPWLEARTALAVLDGAYIPDMWVIPDLYLRVGQADDADVLCQYLLAAQMHEDSEQLDHVRLTWAMARLSPGSAKGGAGRAWSTVFEALDSDQPALAARAAHMLAIRNAIQGDLEATRMYVGMVAEKSRASATLWSWSTEADLMLRSLTPMTTDDNVLALDDVFDDPAERLLRAVRWHDSGCDVAARTVFERIARETNPASKDAKLAARLRIASLLEARQPREAEVALNEMLSANNVLSPDTVFLMARVGVALEQQSLDGYNVLMPVRDRVREWYGDTSSDTQFVQAILDGGVPYAPPAPAMPAPFAAADDVSASVFDVFSQSSEQAASAKTEPREVSSDGGPVVEDAEPVEVERQEPPVYVPPESDLNFPFGRDG